MKETQPEKMIPGNLFDIASLTKVLGTTTSVMLLSDRGLIGIDDHVCKYLKDFGTSEKRRITIRHLLTHTAGLYEWYPLYYKVSNREDCYHLIASLPLKYPVGHERRYSDLGFIILGDIIENLTDLPLDVFMEKNIFGPLGIDGTTFNPLGCFGPSKITATSAGNPYEKRMVYDPSLGFSVKGSDERCASRIFWSHRIHRYQYHCYSSEENFCHYIDQQAELRLASIGHLL
jgi:serine-type D-Ala-D-Ala carboxypeptidase